MLRSVLSNSIRRTNAAGTTKNNGLFLCRGGRMRHLPPLCHYDNKALGYHCASSLASQTNQNMSTASSNDKRLTWQAEHNVDIQRVTQRAIIHELTQEQTRTIETVVPWFLNSMPPSYFRQVHEEYRMSHMKAIAAIKDANIDMHMNLQSVKPDGRQILTFIRPGAETGGLLKLIKDLPWNHNDDGYLPLSEVKVFTAQDEILSISMFTYGEENAGPENVEEAGAHILEYAEALMKGDTVVSDIHPEPEDLFLRENIVNHMKRCSENYIRGADPRRFLQQMKLVRRVSGNEGMAILEEESLDEDTLGCYWLNIAISNSLPQISLENATRLLDLHHFDVLRAHLDMISDGENGDVTMIRVLVSPMDRHRPDKELFRSSFVTPDGQGSRDDIFQFLKRELKRTKWLDPESMDLVFDRYPWLGVRRGEIITGFCSLMHPIMSKINPLAFSKTSIFHTVTKKRYIGHASAIVDLFLDRFHPTQRISQEDFESQRARLHEVIEAEVEDTMAAGLLYKMLEIVSHSLKTNIFMENRYAFGIRLDPSIMVAEQGEDRELPYGILFAHGRRFNGYHVRFRDISRGGMRLVTPPNGEQYALESARQYDECYGLAFAQQLKNKDIPEGGSKAVVLIDVDSLSLSAKNFVMRKSVKAFTDTILDLIVDTPETREQCVDFRGKKEVIYLGPDEQVLPQDINWIVQRAAKRCYDTPNAFMSSKPRAGINHKEYGVTSEGVNVYLDVALREILGIDPQKDSFTLKMTGGPDGDVAGNELKILIREYGDKCQIVGIADHSGCAEDPAGLNHQELMRLFHASLCISHFSESKLGKEGKLHLASTEEGVKARNSMHNRLVADAFVPAGGRPNTIDIHNYKHFLLEGGGRASSPLIVEGANLFITTEARERLFEEAGVAIVKDSSANKGGVITSSYEIICAMLLSEEEFTDNKQQIVNEVLEKLRNFASMEAKLMFREFHNYPGSLPYHSQVISNAINNTTDVVIRALDDSLVSEAEVMDLLPLFRDHLPKTVADLAFDRVKERVPSQYVKNAIASSIASKLVYREGTKFVDAQPQDKLATIALAYIEKGKQVALLRESLENGGILGDSEKEDILALLEAGGARTALNLF